MFTDCQFSYSWKIALVTPILKKDDPKSLRLSNLLPISILPGLSKIEEKVIEIQIHQYLGVYNVLPVF